MRWRATVGVLSCVGGVAFTPGAASPERHAPSSAIAQTSVAREWQLRGVVIAASGPIAILEHVPSGRQELRRVGDSVAAGVEVTAIAPEGVVLDAAGDDVTLRLGHGGPARRAPAPPPVRVRWRPPRLPDRR